MTDLQRLVDGADTAELLIAVDRLVAARAWDELTDLARRCNEAAEYGRQLWPVAMHIDYRLAYEAPPAYAGGVLRPGVARFALGPLTEVAAAGHDWSALAPHIGDPASAVAVAQERVLRGEDLRGHGPARGLDDGLPLVLAPWEPAYALPRYRDRSAAFPQPEAALRPAAAPEPLPTGQVLADDDAVQALTDLVEVWVSQSAGSAAALAVEGDAPAAVGALLAAGDRPPAAALLELTPAEALALLQWTGASGGAYGRRPGGARGRFAAWYAAATLAGIPWPPDERDLGQALGELRWFRWATLDPDTGWVLRLAVEDPVDGLAWAVEALDTREDDEQ